MKRFRYIAFCITLLAQVIVLVHNVIPHHHHDRGIEICSCHTGICHNHSDDHNLHLCDCECESICTDFFNLIGNHNEEIGSTEISQISHITIDNIFSDCLDKSSFKNSSEKCLSQYYLSSRLLRAPPIVL